jgi:CheY-like chemotaxis protein
MPNFIAEWSGILIAVAIIERLLARAETQEAEERALPIREMAALQLLVDVLRPALAFVAKAAPAAVLVATDPPAIQRVIADWFAEERPADETAETDAAATLDRLRTTLPTWEDRYRDVLPIDVRMTVVDMTETARRATGRKHGGATDPDELTLPETVAELVLIATSVIGRLAPEYGDEWLATVFRRELRRRRD